MNRAHKPDAQPFDEIRLVTVPRYKTSGLSGNEWRIKINYQFFRKGKLIIEDCAGHDMDSAVKLLIWWYTKAIDDALGFFAGEGDICDQEGCSEKATVKLKTKKDHCYACGTAREWESTSYRMFCDRHSKRGDCGINDADANYEKIDGEISEPRAEDVKPAAFGGVIQL